LGPPTSNFDSVPAAQNQSGLQNNNEDLPENLQIILKDLISQCEKEDDWVRKYQIKTWKKNEQFWHGNQYIFWSENNQSWMNPANSPEFTEGGRDESPFYDFVINVYKAHGEAIIAALSAQVPAVRFPPDDADNDDDLITSKTYAKISDLILRHNKIKQVILQALFTLWNQGIVAAYHAPKADKAFGKTLIPQYQDMPYCETCEVAGEPDNPDCPTCGEPIIQKAIVSDFKETPKSRIIIDVLGPLNVKVPYYAKKQADFGYLIYGLDQPVALLKNLYPHIADKIGPDRRDDDYERIARSPATYNRDEDNTNLATLKRSWLRPWQFDGLPDSLSMEREQLKKKFPDGAYVGLIGDVYAEARNEDMDKYWTVGKGALSEFIHSDPWGAPLITVQELRNVLVNLTQETIEHGIPSSFADTEVLDFETFSQHEARPGMVYPVKAKPGQKISDGFYEGARATLSKEVSGFMAQCDKDGQFVAGSFPSIYGGPADGKSRTAAEYDMSRQMALQRLSISWSYVIAWFVPMIERCVKLFVETMTEDEKFVKQENGNYINVWIRRAEMTGKVGEVEAEGGENFPVSTAQKQALLLKLLELHNEFLDTAIFDPENRRLIADTLAYPDIFIPGEDQRIKQARETQRILAGIPVPVNPAVDEHAIHIETLKNFMVSQQGLEIEETNPEGYQALTTHLAEHEQIEQQKMMAQAAAAASQGSPGQKVGPPGQKGQNNGA